MPEMKAVIIHAVGNGKPNEVKFEMVSIPDEPPAGHARIKLSAVALNKRDHWIVSNQYANVKGDTIVGSDGVGILTALSPSAPSSLQPLLNKRVIILPSIAWGSGGRHRQGPDFRVLGNTPDNGTFAEYIDIPCENVFPAPEQLDDVQAAALPLAGLTAWRAVKTRGAVDKGMNVLITAAGSGVSTFAMQYAKALGARVWTTSSSKDKIDFAVKTLGVEGGVNYRDKDWTQQLAKLVGGDTTRVIDVIVDSSGTVDECIKLLKPGGRYIFFGNTTQKDHVLTSADMRAIYYLQLQIVGTTMGSPAEFQEMLDFVSTHNVKPVISDVQPFSEAGWKKVLGEMENGDQQGKLVMTMQ